MKTCIYQYWNGSRPAYTYGSEELFRSYADRIGADYFIGDGSISINCLHKRYFGALLPFYSNRFWKYDYVLYVDMDVVPVHDCCVDIFANITGDIMMAEEPRQPEMRENMKGSITAANDKIWAKVIKRWWNVDVELDFLQRPVVYNSGVVAYSNNAIRNFKKLLPSVLSYQLAMKLSGLPRFYSLDQNYLNAFLRKPDVNFSKLPACWNSQVTRWTDLHDVSHLEDNRNNETQFIHLQHGADKNKMTKTQIMDVSKRQFEFKLC